MGKKKSSAPKIDTQAQQAQIDAMNKQNALIQQQMEEARAERERQRRQNIALQQAQEKEKKNQAELIKDTAEVNEEQGKKEKTDVQTGNTSKLDVDWIDDKEIF